MKKFLLMFAIALLAVACGTKETKEEPQTNEDIYVSYVERMEAAAQNNDKNAAAEVALGLEEWLNTLSDDEFAELKEVAPKYTDRLMAAADKILSNDEPAADDAE